MTSTTLPRAGGSGLPVAGVEAPAEPPRVGSSPARRAPVQQLSCARCRDASLDGGRQEREDLGRDGIGRSVGVDEHDLGDAGASTRAGTRRARAGPPARTSSSTASAPGQRPYRLETQHAPLRLADRQHFLLHPAFEHRCGARSDARARASPAPSSRPTTSVGKRSSAVQSRGCSGTSVPPACQSSSARTTRLRSFGWTRAAARGSRRSSRASAVAAPRRS